MLQESSNSKAFKKNLYKVGKGRFQATIFLGRFLDLYQLTWLKIIIKVNKQFILK